MKYYLLEPEVAGGFGPNSLLDPSVRPVRVTKFHYEFDVWLGDPLLETVGCFIVTEPLKDRLLAMRPTGATFGEVEVSKSGEFDDLYPGRKLPRFMWMQVSGKPGQDDLGLSAAQRLVVSERVLDVLKAAGMSHCEISGFRGT